MRFSGDAIAKKESCGIPFFMTVTTDHESAQWLVSLSLQAQDPSLQ